MKLTLVDQEILKSFTKTTEGLAQYYGQAYEIVLHSLENLEKSVIAIFNGEHTGRGVGAPITDVALDMLHKLEETNENSINYFSVNKNGKPLKSSTIAIRGENNRIIGLLCINMYLSMPFMDVMKSFLEIDSSNYPVSYSETFSQNTEELLESIITQTSNKIMNDPSISSQNINKAIIHELDNKGIFSIKHAVNTVAEYLDISINTVYLHIRSNNSKPE